MNDPAPEPCSLFSVVMIRRSQVFGARQPVCELGGIVNQHRQMLRADPQVGTAIV
jgi:hypothetical protein